MNIFLIVLYMFSYYHKFFNIYELVLGSLVLEVVELAETVNISVSSPFNCIISRAIYIMHRSLGFLLA